MNRYAGRLLIAYGNDDDATRTQQDFSHAMLRNSQSDRHFEGYTGSPWHPALASMLVSIGVDPQAFQDACSGICTTVTLEFIVDRDENGEPIQSDNGLALPARHPAITGDNGPNIFERATAFCCVLFWDTDKVVVIMLTADGHNLFEFEDPSASPAVKYIMPRLPDAHFLAIERRLDNARHADHKVLLPDIASVIDETIGHLRVTKIKQGEMSTVLEME